MPFGKTKVDLRDGSWTIGSKRLANSPLRMIHLCRIHQPMSGHWNHHATPARPASPSLPVRSIQTFGTENSSSQG